MSSELPAGLIHRRDLLLGAAALGVAALVTVTVATVRRVRQ
jgi:hypothetical protein